MLKVLNIYKPIGVTPYQLLEQLKITNPEYATVKLAYAGRLDPLAEGVMVVLVGEECRNRHAYEQLPKTYEFSVLLGIATDTYDLMGEITAVTSTPLPYPTAEEIEAFQKSHTGKFTQPYPPFSAARLNGKPLYYWARGQLSAQDLPGKQVEIYKWENLGQRQITTDQLCQSACEIISKVRGDFRQSDIIAQWKNFETDHTGVERPIISFRIDCSSGVYVRSLAHKLGHSLASFAVAVDIKRIRVGQYTRRV